MARIINISGKFSTDRPVIELDRKLYVVNDGLNAIFKFEELAASGTSDGMVKALEVALGEDATEELGVQNLSVSNIRVLITAIIAAIQDISYEEAEAAAEARFRQFKQMV
jgi:hypothetical protein